MDNFGEAGIAGHADGEGNARDFTHFLTYKSTLLSMPFEIALIRPKQFTKPGRGFSMLSLYITKRKAGR